MTFPIQTPPHHFVRGKNAVCVGLFSALPLDGFRNDMTGLIRTVYESNPENHILVDPGGNEYGRYRLNIVKRYDVTIERQQKKKLP